MLTARLSKITELLIGGIGASQAFYLSLHAFFERKRDYKNLLLGFLFLVLSIRIIKSLLWVYWDATPMAIVNFGFMAHAASAPLFSLYAYHFIFGGKWSRLSWFHFMPALFLAVFCFSLTLDGFWYNGGYTLLLYHQMGYSIAGLSFVLIGLKRRKALGNSLTKKDWVWVIVLTIGTLAVQLSYFLNYILGLTPYLLAPVVYAVFVYFVSFYSLRNPQVFKNGKRLKKYRNINLTDENLVQYSERLRNIMDLKRPYLDPNCNLTTLAEELRMPTYLLSHLINKKYAQNFSDFINRYRIERAKEMLMNADFQNLKISSIAYESGFNSLSSFNAAFKKFIGTTPSRFRNK